MQPFLNTGFTFANFRDYVKSPLLIEKCLDRWTKSVNISEFSLKVLVGTSVSWQGSKAPKQTVSWKISFFSTLENLNKSFDFGTLSMAFIPGWSWYCTIAFIIRFEMGHSGRLRLRYILEKQVFRTSATVIWTNNFNIFYCYSCIKLRYTI